MRFCIVYDCLYPCTVGGAERWLRSLCDELVAAGHEVTYVTRAQWDDAPPPWPGVRVVAVSPPGPLYDAAGRRRARPPLEFGRGVLGHLLRRRGAYDVVHTCSFPYFSLLAARVALSGTSTRIGVDWFEFWSAEYWRDYLGAAGGTVGRLVQRCCARVRQQPFTYSRLVERRLLAVAPHQPPVRLAGILHSVQEPAAAAPAADPPVVLYAGRHIPEKRVHLLPPALAAVRRDRPEVRGLILGDGPERERVRAEVERHGLGVAVQLPGFVAAEEVARAMRRAACLVLPSSREGYGLVVVEAAACGTPVVVVAGPDNAAVELVEEGVNGTVASAPDADTVAAAIARVLDGGLELRRRTAAWYADHADELSARTSARRILSVYR